MFRGERRQNARFTLATRTLCIGFVISTICGSWCSVNRTTTTSSNNSASSEFASPPVSGAGTLSNCFATDCDEEKKWEWSGCESHHYPPDAWRLTRTRWAANSTTNRMSNENFIFRFAFFRVEFRLRVRCNSIKITMSIDNCTRSPQTIYTSHVRAVISGAEPTQAFCLRSTWSSKAARSCRAFGLLPPGSEWEVEEVFFLNLLRGGVWHLFACLEWQSGREKKALRSVEWAYLSINIVMSQVGWKTYASALHSPSPPGGELCLSSAIFTFTVVTVVKHVEPRGSRPAHVEIQETNKRRRFLSNFLTSLNTLSSAWMARKRAEKKRNLGTRVREDFSVPEGRVWNRWQVFVGPRGAEAKRVRKSTRLLSYFRKIWPEAENSQLSTRSKSPFSLRSLEPLSTSTSREFIRASVAHAVSRLKINRKSSSRTQRAIELSDSINQRRRHKWRMHNGGLMSFDISGELESEWVVKLNSVRDGCEIYERFAARWLPSIRFFRVAAFRWVPKALWIMT